MENSDKVHRIQKIQKKEMKEKRKQERIEKKARKVKKERSPKTQKVRFVVPNLFTGFNFMMGLFAIFIMIEGIMGHDIPIFGSGRPPIVLAAWLIVWCVLLDKLDGFAAKRLNATSGFGAQFDSMADLLSFGLAPGLLVYCYLQKYGKTFLDDNRIMIIAAIALYTLCGAMRLARFNSMDIDDMGSYFNGLAITIAGAAMTLVIIIFDSHQILKLYPDLAIIIPIMLLVTGFLMVSTLYLPKLAGRKSRAFNYFQIVNIAGAYICGFAMLLPEYLMGLILAYLSVGFTWGLIRRERINRELKKS